MEAAKQACKVAAFDMAQANMEEAKAFQDQKVIDAAAVKKAYDAKAAFPTGGAEGALCHYPKIGEDEAQGPRPPCSEEGAGGDPEKPLCCGAAQRFLKDGTKLSIETCQQVGTNTYTYYPALPDGAIVEPEPETWRFQCISAAQKLAAAATAALAAGYMMA